MANKKPADIDDVLNVIGDLTDLMNRRFDKLEGRSDDHEARFDKLEGRFDKLEARSDDHEANFDKLEGRFDKLEGRFDNHEARFDKLDMSLFNQGEDLKALKSDMSDTKKKVDRIYDVLDAHMKRIEDILQDNATRDHQQERMERWIFQLADRMDVKLKYE